MADFKVGEKIVAYHNGLRHVVGVYGIEGESTIKAFIKNTCTYLHPKQCRRLKKKKERRRVWIHEIDIPKRNESSVVRHIWNNSEAPKRHNPCVVEFVEVRRKK